MTKIARILGCKSKSYVAAVGSSRKSVGKLRFGDGAALEKLAELVAGGFEGAQVSFGVTMREEGTSIKDNLEEEFFNRHPPQAGRLIEIANDLAAENPKVVGVFADGRPGIGGGQMRQERTKAGHNPLPRFHVPVRATPTECNYLAMKNIF